MQFNIEQSQNKKQPFYVLQVAPNGRKLNASETLTKRSGAMNNIRSVYKGLGGTKKVKIIDFTVPGEKVYFIENGKITKE